MLTLFQKKDKTQPAALSGTDLRNRSWGIINRANFDYAPKYIGITDTFNEASRAADGLIRTPLGYYRLAEDMRDGTRILLHSYERGQLTGIERDGKIMLDPDATDIYAVTARRDVRGSIFRDDMHHDNRHMETWFQKDLNLHVDEVLGADGRRTVRLANSHAAFGIYEMADGRWKVRLYINLRKSWDKAAQFAQADTNANNSLLAKLSTLSRDMGVFANYEDAFQHVRKFWKNESSLVFKGLSSLEDPSTFSGFERFKTMLLSSALHFMDSKAYRDWRRSILLGVAVGFVSTLVSGTPLLGAALGLGSGFTWSVIGKVVESAVTSIENKKLEKTDQKQFESLRPYFEQNMVDRYLLQDPATERRFRKKIDPSHVPHLRLLNQLESDMNYDDGASSTPDNPLTDFERLSTAPHRYFGAQFDATHADRGVLVCIYPNGLLSVIQIDKDTRETRHYLTYNERFNAFAKDADKKHLDPRLTHLPEAGPIHKITHGMGRGFGYASLTREEFMACLMDKAGPEAKDFRAFGFSLADLFSVKAGEPIEPKGKETVPVRQLMMMRRELLPA